MSPGVELRGRATACPRSYRAYELCGRSTPTRAVRPADEARAVEAARRATRRPSGRARPPRRARTARPAPPFVGGAFERSRAGSGLISLDDAVAGALGGDECCDETEQGQAAAKSRWTSGEMERSAHARNEGAQGRPGLFGTRRRIAGKPAASIPQPVLKVSASRSSRRTVVSARSFSSARAARSATSSASCLAPPAPRRSA